VPDTGVRRPAGQAKKAYAVRVLRRRAEDDGDGPVRVRRTRPRRPAGGGRACEAATQHRVVKTHRELLLLVDLQLIIIKAHYILVPAG
jgi:hypothetical protein